MVKDNALSVTPETRKGCLLSVFNTTFEVLASPIGQEKKTPSLYRIFQWNMWVQTAT